MEFFGIGAPELMVILIIAIVMFGPDKIPTMAAQVGRTIRDFRRYTSELTKEFDAATGDLRQEFQNIAGDLRGELEATQADLRSQLDLTDAFKMDAPKETVATGVGTTIEPPLATLEPSSVTGVAATATETITVTTPYAEALTAREAAGTPAVATSAARATKADPFADLVTLVASTPTAAPAMSVETAPVQAVPETPAITSNGHRKVIGGSVSGSKYLRRKSA